MKPEDTIIQSACVTRCDADRAWVRCQPRAGCQRCAEGRGCGAGALNAWMASDEEEIEVINSLGAEPGQRVEISISRRQALRSAIRLYGIPLAGILLGALVGAAFWPHIRDIAALSGATVCLLAGMLIVRRLESRQPPMMPYVSAALNGRNSADHSELN